MNLPLKIFAGSAGQKLCADICARIQPNNHFSSVPGEIYLHMFPSGEHYCQYRENIRGCDVFLIQPICNPAHERLMELLVMIDAAKRASAGRITVVAPYLGYLRQDRKTKSRTPITARLVADMLEAAGADRIVGMDFHCDQAQGFFNIPVDHLYAAPIFISYIAKLYASSDIFPVIVSPDAGGIKRANAFAENLNTGFAFIAKKRIDDFTVESSHVVGDVKGRDVLIVDDMTESCGTIIEAARVCKYAGANSIRAAVTHGLFNSTAVDRLRNDSSITELITTDTVSTEIPNKVKVLSVASLFATAISHINQDKSITELFKIKGL